MEGYFLNIKNIQDKINCCSHKMTLLLIYFFENPSGNYYDFQNYWQSLYKDDYYKNIKHEIFKLREFNILTVDEKNIYNFNPNGDKYIISELSHLTNLSQYEEANKIIDKKYQIKFFKGVPMEQDFAGLYKIYNKETKELLYIGSSIHLFQRKIEHYRCALWPLDVKNYYSKKYTMLRELIEKDLLDWQICCLPDQSNIDIKKLRQMEKRWIKKEKPLLNVQWNN